METGTIQNAANTLLTDAMLAVVSLAGAYGIYFIRLCAAKVKSQTAQLRNERTRWALDTALDDVRQLAELSVNAMEQTTAKALRENVKNGTADREELLALGKTVFDEVKAAVGPEAQATITRTLGSFDDYLTKCIEEAVLKVKQNDPLVMLPESIPANEGAF